MYAFHQDAIQGQVGIKKIELKCVTQMLFSLTLFWERIINLEIIMDVRIILFVTIKLHVQCMSGHCFMRVGFRCVCSFLIKLKNEQNANLTHGKML
jgi:hypothetical protein